MSLSMFQVTVPPLVRGLKALSAVLDKAAVYAETKKFDPKVLLEARLFPNMFALTKQVQVVTDQAKGGVARLAGLEVPKFEDTEASIPELKARIAKVLDFIATVKPEQLQGAETRDITLTFPNGSMSFTGVGFLNDFVLPNFYFHSAMAYGLLRHNGVELGKMDFIAPPK